MDGETFAHDGRSGRWSCTIYLLKAQDGGFCGGADIALRGRQRCKQVLSLPCATQAEGVAALKRKCIDWIEAAEAGGVDLSAPPLPAGV